VARSAREEAQGQIGDTYAVCVLEPSPPAIAQEPWFADDPLRRDPDDPRPLVSPVSGLGDLRYEDVPGIDAAWCRERWLGFHRRLEPVNNADEFTRTRRTLHRLAERTISPARERANGKIGLRFTKDGFGTPFFGEDEQLRVEGTTLVGAGANEPIDVDAQAARQLADVFGFAASVLEELRAAAGEDLEPSRVQLWPEHFDMSVELGAEEAGRRAGYGVSPGDADHPEPYAYVVPWREQPPGGLWQASGFAGAELTYSDLLLASDQRALALSFFRTRLASLDERIS
jgi:hypothetical protein